MAYGERIAILRKKRNLTQEELAKRIGITRAALSHYEKDRREPDYETLQKFADFFDVKIDYLLGRTNDPSPLGKQSASKKEYDYHNDPRVTGEVKVLLDILALLPQDEQKQLIEQTMVYIAGLKAKRQSPNS